MPTSTAFLGLRAIGVTLVALFTILALLGTRKSLQIGHPSVNEVTVSQAGLFNVPAALRIETLESSTSSARLGNVALPFGRQDHAFNFSPVSKWSPIKRVLGPQWQCLVEKGDKYIRQGVLPAYEGRSNFPTPTFTDASFKENGWQMPPPVDEPLPLHWEEAFKLVPEGAPAPDEDSEREDEVSRVYMDQSLPFTNAQGQRDTPPTGGTYYGLYLPEACAIITSVSYSPTYSLEQAGVAEKEIPSLIPPLHQLSDVLWAVWESLLYEPGNLRYYAVEGISNAVAKPLMDEIFNARRETIVVPWANRLTFDLNSQEGKALFASPNGIAAAWFLIHRAADLGRRNPVVTIFNPDGDNRCMIWDLAPQGEPSVFGPPTTDG